MILLSIPTPCHENWDAMLPNEKGAFCNACAKTVVDFSAMTDDEITGYFLQHRGQKTCGRFSPAQLIMPVANEINLPAVLASSLPRWKKYLAILVVVFGGFLTGCTLGVPMGKVAVNAPVCRPDTTAPTRHVVGDTIEYQPAKPVSPQAVKTVLKNLPPAKKKQ